MRSIVAPSILSLVYLTCAVAKDSKPADPVFVQKESSMTPMERNKTACSPGPGSRAAIGYRGPKGLGYDHGYATFSTFLSPSGERPFQPFIDLRGHVFNDGRWAANAGLGGRFALDKAVLGLNAYYDFRDTKQLGGQNQVGGGFEVLSQWVDFRVNGYVPVGKTTGKECPCFDHFACNSAFARQVVRASLADIDAEIGFDVPRLKYVDLYFAVGPYYLFEKTVCDYSLGGEWGGRARVSLKVYDGVTLGGDITYDPIFNTKAQGWITLSFPFGPANMVQNGSRFKENYPVPCDETARQFARMTQPVYRNEIIPVENKTRIFNINCECCCPSQIYFVNNCNCDEGCGTFENPFNTLSQAEGTAGEGDIIYVFPGDGTSNGMNTGFVMKDRQRLISSAACFDLCDICIPACTPGRKPLIENTQRTIEVNSMGIFVNSGFGVLMADCSEVAGFCFNGTNEPDGVTFNPGVVLYRGNSFTLRDSFFANQLGVAVLRENEVNRGDIVISGNCFRDMRDSFGQLSAIGFINPVVNTNLTFCNDFFENFSISTFQPFGAIVAGVLFQNEIKNSALVFKNCRFNNFNISSNEKGNIVGISSSGPKNSSFLISNSSFNNFKVNAEESQILGVGVGITGGVLNTSLCSNNSCFSNFTIEGSATQTSAVMVGIGFGVAADLGNVAPLFNSPMLVCNSRFDNFNIRATGASGSPSKALPDTIIYGVASGSAFDRIDNANILNSPITCSNTCFNNFNASLEDVAGGLLQDRSVSVIGIASASAPDRLTDVVVSSSPIECSNTSFNNFNASIKSISNRTNNCQIATYGIASASGASNNVGLNSAFNPITCCNASFRNFSSSIEGVELQGQELGVYGIASATGIENDDLEINASGICCYKSKFSDFSTSAIATTSSDTTTALVCGIGSASAASNGSTDPNSLRNSPLICCNNSLKDFNNYLNAPSGTDDGTGIFGLVSGCGGSSNEIDDFENSPLYSNANSLSDFTTFINTPLAQTGILGIGSGSALASTDIGVYNNNPLVCNNSSLNDFTASALEGNSVVLGVVSTSAGGLSAVDLVQDSSVACNNSVLKNFKAIGAPNLTCAITGVSSASAHISSITTLLNNSGLTCRNSSFIDFTADSLTGASIFGAVSASGNETTFIIEGSEFCSSGSIFKNFSIAATNDTGTIFGFAVGSGGAIVAGSSANTSPLTCVDSTFNDFSVTSDGPARIAAVAYGLQNNIFSADQILLTSCPVCCNNSSFETFNAQSNSSSEIYGIMTNAIVQNSFTCANSRFEDFSNTGVSTITLGILTSVGEDPSMLGSGSIVCCNNVFDQINAVNPVPVPVFGLLDVALLTSNIPVCVEQNDFFSGFFTASAAGIPPEISCLALKNNTNRGSYFISESLIGGTFNVESPNLADLQAGLESINTGTFALVEGTAVPLGTCGCPSCNSCTKL